MNTEKWTHELDAVTAAFQAEFGGLSQAQMNQKPNPEEWSIAQNIDHLITINNTYPPVIQSVRDGSYKLPFIGKIGFLVRFLGSMILKGVGPGREKKIKTFEIWEPSQSEIPEGILDKFAAEQEKIKSMMSESVDLLEKGTVISSPASNKIVYKLETAFQIIVDHEKRHLAQAREVLLRIKN